MGVSHGTKVTKMDIATLMEDCRSLYEVVYGYNMPGIDSVSIAVQNSTLAIPDGMSII